MRPQALAGSKLPGTIVACGTIPRIFDKGGGADAWMLTQSPYGPGYRLLLWQQAEDGQWFEVSTDRLPPL